MPACTPYSRVSFRMTLSDFELLSVIFYDMKHRAQWRIYHWATWAMPPYDLRKISHMAKNATLEKLPQLFCMCLMFYLEENNTINALKTMNKSSASADVADRNVTWYVL